MVLLNDAEWSGWSNREIARRVGVNHKTVIALRPEKDASVTGEIPSDTCTYTTKHGTIAQMRTGNIGHSRPAAPPQPPSSTTIYGNAGAPKSAPAWTMADIATDSDDPPLPFSETDPEPTRGRHFPRGRLAQPWNYQGSTPNPVR